MKTQLFKASIVISVLIWPHVGTQNVQAAPIIYSFTGLGTGTIGSTAFMDAAFQLSIFGDTTDVRSYSNLPLGNQPLTGTIDIAGVGLATFSMSLYVWSSTDGLGGLGQGNVIGFGGLSPVNRDLIDIVGSFPPYDLKSRYEPVTSRNVVLFQFRTDQFRPDPIGTTLGNLAYASMSDVTFQSDLQAIPEPTCLALLGLSSVVFAGWRRWRK